MTIKVMLVDDDEVLLEVTKEHLCSAGYQVSVRPTALGTSAAVQRERPDILVLDVSMPALQGDALAKLLQANGAAAPAIVLYSSRSSEELAKLAADCGAVGYIRKTADRAQFLADFQRSVAGAGRQVRRRPSAW